MSSFKMMRITVSGLEEAAKVERILYSMDYKWTEAAKNITVFPKNHSFCIYTNQYGFMFWGYPSNDDVYYQEYCLSKMTQGPYTIRPVGEEMKFKAMMFNVQNQDETIKLDKLLLERGYKWISVMLPAVALGKEEQHYVYTTDAGRIYWSSTPHFGKYDEWSVVKLDNGPYTIRPKAEDVKKFQEMKFRVKNVEHSKAIQRALFDLGHRWNYTDNSNVKNTNAECLYAEYDGSITYSSLPYFSDRETADIPEYELVDGKFKLVGEESGKFKEMKFRPETCKENLSIQKYLVDLGYRWFNAGDGILECMSDKTFLYTSKEGHIYWGYLSTFDTGINGRKPEYRLKEFTSYELEEVVQETIEIDGRRYLKKDYDEALAKLNPVG